MNLPRPPNALEEVWHPHGQYHCLSQQLLGILQISYVIPAEEREVDGARERERERERLRWREKDREREC